MLTLSPDKMRIEFDLRVWNRAQDGIDIEIAEGAQVTLELNGNTVWPARLVQMGAERWPLESLPVVLAR